MGYVSERTKAEQREIERGAYLKCSYIKVLGLTLAEGAVYAIVRSFSEKYRDGFTGAQSYISSVIGITVRSVAAALSSLVSRGLITKKYITVNNKPHPVYFSDGSLESELVARYLDELDKRYSAEEASYGKTATAPEGKDEPTDSAVRAEGIAARSNQAPKKCGLDNGCATGNSREQSGAGLHGNATGNSREQSGAGLHGNATGNSEEKIGTPSRGFVIGEGETGYVAHLRPRASDKPQRSVKYFSRGKGDEVNDAMLRALERTYGE